MENRKIYVDVIASFDQQGTVRPMAVIWEDGRRFEIDRITAVKRACSTKVGGTGIRYTVFVKGKQTYLYEDEGRWFVEAKSINT